MIPVLRIGSFVADSPAVLAPMAGYTNLPCRLLARRFGAGLVYTELTSVDGLIRHSKATLHILETVPAERPVVAHLYGHDPKTFADAAAIVEAIGTYDLIDINAGCPVPKIVKRGAGAGLIKDPERLFAIVRAVKGAVKHLPVTVKTRIGASPTQCNISDLARGVEDAGADAIALHARYTSVRHSGPADWDVIARIKQERKIPVIGNGGILTAEQAVEFLHRYGVDGVMIGRAAMGNPWLFQHINSLLRGEPWTPPTVAERRAVMLEHVERTVELSRLETRYRKRRLDPDTAGPRHFRAHLIKYLAGFRGSIEMKRGLNDIFTVADTVAAMDAVFAQVQEGGDLNAQH